jgi:4-phospho-D-threonate 3-dehydrogenase / 4-phospho-D-erythronate 3-dehydrogenase
MIVISTGCPAGIGPEISVKAAAEAKSACLLVGDFATLKAASKLVGVDPQRLVRWTQKPLKPKQIPVLQAGPKLAPIDRVGGKPSKISGRAQLDYIEAAFDWVKANPGSALVTAPVSKAVIAKCGLSRAKGFLGHTEWLEARDGAKNSTMCFTTRKFATSLVTTHVAIRELSSSITAKKVTVATTDLADLLACVTKGVPKIAVCSLNPHAGESALLGNEEAIAIIPGIKAAQRLLGKRAEVFGPIGAETAYRKAEAGHYHGVVAMYHDQATIPTKLIAFGEAVNVTWGLSVIRTSVDHGTGYDIAWTGKADDRGMRSAILLARRLIVAQTKHRRDSVR